MLVLNGQEVALSWEVSWVRCYPRHFGLAKETERLWQGTSLAWRMMRLFCGGLWKGLLSLMLWLPRFWRSNDVTNIPGWLLVMCQLPIDSDKTFSFSFPPSLICFVCTTLLCWSEGLFLGPLDSPNLIHFWCYMYIVFIHSISIHPLFTPPPGRPSVPTPVPNTWPRVFIYQRHRGLLDNWSGMLGLRWICILFQSFLDKWDGMITKSATLLSSSPLWSYSTPSLFRHSLLAALQFGSGSRAEWDGCALESLGYCFCLVVSYIPSLDPPRMPAVETLHLFGWPFSRCSGTLLPTRWASQSVGLLVYCSLDVFGTVLLLFGLVYNWIRHRTWCRFILGRSI